jgi:hypothetical protein
MPFSNAAVSRAEEFASRGSRRHVEGVRVHATGDALDPSTSEQTDWSPSPPPICSGIGAALGCGGAAALAAVGVLERLSTSRGALYKTIHDARRKLRAALAERGLTVDAETATTL